MALGEDSGFFEEILGQSSGPIASFMRSAGERFSLPGFGESNGYASPAFDTGLISGPAFGAGEFSLPSFGGGGLSGFLEGPAFDNSATARARFAGQMPSPQLPGSLPRGDSSGRVSPTTNIPTRGSGAALSGDQAEFLTRVRSAAAAQAPALGIDPDLVVAVAAHESGWGKHPAPGSKFNIFNMRQDANSWQEFDSVEDAVAGFLKLISRGRYSTSYGLRSDPYAQVAQIAADGYLPPDEWGGWISSIRSIYQQLKNTPASPTSAATRASGFVPGETPQSPDDTPRPVYRTQFGYGQRYTNGVPGLQGGSHRGVDLVRDDLPDNGRGSAIYPFVDGTVTLVGAPGGGTYGEGYVVVRDAEGNDHWYMHIDASYVKQGQAVTRHTPIATLGASGIDVNNQVEGGPHLHYEVRRGGQSVDPSPWLLGG